jgi:hypothetical protein
VFVAQAAPGISRKNSLKGEETSRKFKPETTVYIPNEQTVDYGYDGC